MVAQGQPSRPLDAGMDPIPDGSRLYFEVGHGVDSTESALFDRDYFLVKLTSLFPSMPLPHTYCGSYSQDNSNAPLTPTKVKVDHGFFRLLSCHELSIQKKVTSSKGLTRVLRYKVNFIWPMVK
ncbi:hypothetical protein CR513_43176, partial [Mucuna pruriens]